MNINQLTGIIVTVFGMIYGWMALRLPRAAYGDPLAPAIFPILLGIALVICGIILTVTEGRNPGAPTMDKKPLKGHGLSHDTKLIIYTCAVTLIYAVIFNPLGYVLATLFFMNAMLFALNGKEQWKTNLVVSASFSVGIYLIFMKALGISLPMMPIVQI